MVTKEDLLKEELIVRTLNINSENGERLEEDNILNIQKEVLNKYSIPISVDYSTDMKDVLSNPDLKRFLNNAEYPSSSYFSSMKINKFLGTNILNSNSLLTSFLINVLLYLVDLEKEEDNIISTTTSTIKYNVPVSLDIEVCNIYGKLPEGNEDFEEWVKERSVELGLGNHHESYGWTSDYRDDIEIDFIVSRNRGKEGINYDKKNS